MTRSSRAVVVATVLALALPGLAGAQSTEADPLPPTGTLLEPGRYVSDVVGPSLDFRVDDGWIVGASGNGPIFTLERAATPGTVLSITRFDGDAYFDSCDPTSLTTVETSVPRLVEIIAGNPFLNAARPDVIDVDGYAGLTVDLAVPEFPECSLPFLLLWKLQMEDGDFVQVGGQQSRFVAVDVDGDVLVLAIESFPYVPFGDLFEASMELIDSMRIEPGEYVPPPLPSPSAPADA